MNFTIKRKLYSMICVLALSLAALAAVTYERFGRTAQIEDELNVAHRMEVLASDMERSLLEARRREKDFFAREGEEQYSDIVAQQGVRFLKASAELRQLAAAHTKLTDDRTEGALAELDDLMKQYESTFTTVEQVFHERGLPDTGIQRRMRDAAHEIESIAEQLDDPQVLVTLLQARRAEKDFMLRGDQKYQELAVSYVARLDGLLKARNEHADERRRARDLLRTYGDNFGAFNEATKRLDALQAELHDNHAKLEPKLHDIAASSERHAATSLAEVQDVRTQALSNLLIAFGLVLGFGILAVTWVSRHITLGIGHLIDGTRRVATGDLTTVVSKTSNDELGQLADAFNKMMHELRELNERINTTSNTLVSIAGELNASVSEQSASMRQQAAAVTETVTTIEQMTRSASSVAETAQTVSIGAATSMETSTRGEAALKQSVEGMLNIRDQVQNIAATILDLSEKTQQIGNIIATVDDFAEQSSLLALNASIEAARAGEQGRAFSVVAAEIKKLAEQSQNATDRVRGILNEIQRVTHSAVMVTEEGSKRVDRGVGLVEAAGNIVMELAETIKNSSRSAKQIAAAAQQQASGVGQVSTAMTGIDQSSRQNVAAIKQTETASQTLAEITRELQKTTARYRLA